MTKKVFLIASLGTYGICCASLLVSLAVVVKVDKPGIQISQLLKVVLILLQKLKLFGVGGGVTRVGPRFYLPFSAGFFE